MDDVKAPERIWAVFLEHEAGGLPSVHASCSKTKGTAYVRGDLYSAISKERYELQAGLNWLKRSIFGSDDYHPSLLVGNFAEMAQITEVARKAAFERAEKAEDEVERLRQALQPFSDACGFVGGIYIEAAPQRKEGDE